MSKVELNFRNPVMNAAGTLGFSPNPKGKFDISGFGAFVTNPISLTPRKPAVGQRVLSFPGGILVHTGYPNPGLSSIIRKHGRRWSNSPIPVVVHLLAQEVYSLKRMVQRLEGLEGVMGVEVGLPPQADSDLVIKMIQAVIGELAVILRIPFEDIYSGIRNSSRLDTIRTLGIDAISMAPARGCLLDDNNNLVAGRLYGPSQFPQSLSAVECLMEMGVPVIASGGIYNRRDIQVLLDLGVAAVQLDSVIWRPGFSLSTMI